MLNIIGRLFSRHRTFLVATALLLGTFQILLCEMVASMDMESAFGAILAFAPPVMRTFLEQSMLGGSSAGVLAFGWDHPLSHALVSAGAIVLGSRAIAGEIENGVIEMILAQPLSRAAYFAAQVVFGMLSISAVALTGIFGTFVGQRLCGLHLFGWDRLLEVFAGLILLETSIYALTLLISSFGSEAGRVAGAGALLTIGSFLTNLIANLWSKAAFLKPYSLHAYYDPRNILVYGHLEFSSLLTLAALALLAMSAAFIRFTTRDLP